MMIVLFTCFVASLPDLIPYPEPYQSLYQQRRLGALGIEWTPSNVFLSIGTTDDVAYTNPSNPPLALPLPIVPPSPVQQNRRGPQTAPGNRWVEQPSEVDEAMDWEQEVAGLSEDTGSDYSASEESRSEEAGGNQGGGDSHEEEAFGSEEEGWEERDSHTHLRRSGRNKRKAEVCFLHYSFCQRLSIAQKSLVRLEDVI
jgi:PH-interacting protein